MRLRLFLQTILGWISAGLLLWALCLALEIMGDPMTSHDQAVHEVMETFGMTEAEAEQMVDLEEGGFVMDENGAILPNVDPDAPIEMPLIAETDESARWN